jgi:hypothetical protein
MVSSISFRIPIYIASFFCLLYLFRHLIPYTTPNYYFHESSYRNVFGSTVHKTGRKRVPSEIITTNPIGALTFQYQNRLNELSWRETQCDFLKTCIQENQTVFPYLSIPPNPLEYEEQFNVVPLPSTIRIAVLHIWSSSESLPPPFYSYWLVSAMANSDLIDFLIFVPDNTTQILLKQSIQSSDVDKYSDGKDNNIHIHVVGDFKSYYTSRLGSILEDASYTFHPMTVSRLKPMLGYVFEDYLTNYSHWAWADMDIILGNLTKFLIRPLVEGYSVISISSMDYIHGTWASHLCSRFEVALAGQFTVFINTPKSRNYFRQCDLKHDLRHRFDEGAFPKALRLLGVQVAHVFAQVTDQFGFLNDTELLWSPKGLVWYRSSLKCFDYEVAMVHVMKGKRLIRPPPRRSNRISVDSSIRNGYRNDTSSQSGSSLLSNQSTMDDDLPTMEQIIFPNLFKRGTTLQGFTLRFPVSVSRPWKMVSAPTLPWVSCT